MNFNPFKKKVKEPWLTTHREIDSYYTEEKEFSVLQELGELPIKECYTNSPPDKPNIENYLVERIITKRYCKVEIRKHYDYNVETTFVTKTQIVNKGDFIFSGVKEREF